MTAKKSRNSTEVILTLISFDMCGNHTKYLTKIVNDAMFITSWSQFKPFLHENSENPENWSSLNTLFLLSHAYETLT